MRVTRKRVRKSKLARKRRERTKNGPLPIEDLAHFLNLDMADSDIQKRWHFYQSWKFGISTSASDEALRRYPKLKLLTSILEERDIQPLRPDLIEHLRSLQDKLKADLKPILRSSPKKNEQSEIENGRKAGIRNIIARFNQCTFSPRWARYSKGEIMENKGEREGWWCTYEPEASSRVTKVDTSILAHGKVLRLGNSRYVVREVAPRADSIADRLYWIVLQTFIDASIYRLKNCVECKRYFSAYDVNQVVCSLS